ncbi:MAG: hypothetical protein QM783_04400 [Phycisphaerales bacterium]
MSIGYTIQLADGRSFGPADEAMLRTWAQEGRIPPVAKVVGSDGSSCRAIDCPPIAEIMSRIAAAPPTAAGALPQGETDVGVVIPYKNGAALAGYYTSVASLIPVVGLIAGPVAVFLGIKGLQAVKANPKVHGTAHAWVAIILGGLVSLAYVALIILMIVAALTHR